MGETMSMVLEPLVRRQVFPSQEEGLRTLAQDYLLRQINLHRREIARLERKYSMTFDRFADYLHHRSLLLQEDNLTPEQRVTLGQAIMQEEDDWLDWKAASEGVTKMANVKSVGEVYRCEICGNVVEVKEVGGGELVCCGEPMTLVKK